MNLTRGFRLPNTNKGISKFLILHIGLIFIFDLAVRYSDNSKNKAKGGVVENKKDDRQSQRGGDQNRRNDR